MILSPQHSFAIDPAPPASTQPAAPAPNRRRRRCCSRGGQFHARRAGKAACADRSLSDALLLKSCRLAYPLQIVQAQRWLTKNQAAAAKSDFSGADAQSWDPS